MDIEYTGPPSLVGLFAEALEDEGLTVVYTPPIETRGLREVADVGLDLIVSGASATLIDTGVRKVLAELRDRFPNVKLKRKRKD